MGENTIDIANSSRPIRENEIETCAQNGETGDLPELPDVEIAAYIPGTKHGTREVFEEKVMLQGCEDSGAMQAMADMGH